MTSNVILLVWDACRYSESVCHAPNLQNLRKENLDFTKAISPSTWTLPSHVSLFSGTYPHEHGVFSPKQTMDSIPLVDELKEQNYTCYGVSGNPIISQLNGFHRGYDEFYYSPVVPYPSGLNPSKYFETLNEDPIGTGSEMLGELMTGPDRLRSVANLLNAGIQFGTSRMTSAFSRIPHPLLDEEGIFAYSPEQNTNLISDILHREANSGKPFFIFANYMDTHRPYAPREQFQREILGEALSYRKIRRINKEFTHPWNFYKNQSQFSEETAETIRRLYETEVRSADQELGRILESLNETGQRDETVVIVTSDHGENLGVDDETGQRRMGHQASTAETILRAPLIIAHPEIEERTIDTPVSVKRLYRLLVHGKMDLIESKGRELGALVTDDLVAAQDPAKGIEKLYEHCPEVPREVVDAVVKESSAVVYRDDWKLKVSSGGDAWAWKDGKELSVEDAPDEVLMRCRNHLKEMERKKTSGGMSESVENQLKNLGYI